METNFWESIANTWGFRGWIRQQPARYPHLLRARGTYCMASTRTAPAVFCDFLLANKMKLYSVHT